MSESSADVGRQHVRGPSFHFHSEQSHESRQLAYKSFLENGDAETKRLQMLNSRRKKMFESAFAKRQSVAVESEMSKLDELGGNAGASSKLKPVHQELKKV